MNKDAVTPAVFPPLEHAQVKALACERVFYTHLPFSRQSLADLSARASVVLRRPISRSSVWRILHREAIAPWRYEHWIFPRDPDFVRKAARVLDLYAGCWEGKPLSPRDFVLSADEKTSIQARRRIHPTLAPGPARCRRLEHEYKREGALQYLAAWDVRRGRVMGRCEARSGIAPFARLVAQVMEQEPYRQARRVFWVVDNGSSHRGNCAIKRLAQAYPRAILVHTPVHASWLNQVEIYFSIVQRKALTPNDFTSLKQVETRLALYEELTNSYPCPFDWQFDRTKLLAFWERLQMRLAAQAHSARA